MKYVSLRPSDTDNTYEPMYDHTLDTSDIGDDVITTTPMPDLDGLVHHQQGHVVAISCNGIDLGLYMSHVRHST